MHPDGAFQADFLRELKAIQAESIGWLPLGQGVYLHRGAQSDTELDLVIEVVGVADSNMADLNVLWMV
jgi:hypothetical protein